MTTYSENPEVTLIVKERRRKSKSSLFLFFSLSPSLSLVPLYCRYQNIVLVQLPVCLTDMKKFLSAEAFWGGREVVFCCFLLFLECARWGGEGRVGG